MRAVIWCAVSSEEQARDDKASLQYQESLGRDHAMRHGLDVVDVITSDDSRTITLYEDACRNPRLGYARLDEHLRRRDFDVLLYMDTTRLGRKANLGMTVMERCLDHGVRLYDCSNPPASLDAPQTETDRYVRAFHALNSQGEIDKLRKRNQFGMSNRIRRGNIANSTVWGYSITYDRDGTPAITLDANVAAIVRDVFAMYLDGHGTPRIAELLNAAGTPAQSGTWTPSAVRNVIRRVWRYAGYAELNVRTTANRPYIRARGNWQPAIDDATAERVVAEQAYRASNRRVPDTPYLLSGICICGTCGAAMHVQQHVRKSRNNYRWMSVSCDKHTPGEYASYAHVLRFVRAMLTTLDLAAIAAAEDDDALSAITASMDRQRAIIAAAEAALARAADEYTDGAMSVDNYRRQVQRKQAQIDAANAELERLDQRAEAERQQGNRRARLLRASEIGLAMLEHPDPTTANAYLRSLLRVTIHANRVQRGNWL